MAEALEERATQEVVDRDVAIEALQNELDTVESEKKQLVEEVVGLRAAEKDFKNLKAKVESLSKALEDVKAAEQLALEHVQKANETTEDLRKEVDAERQSSSVLGAQVALLTKRLEEVKVVGLSAVGLYINALAVFGGVASSLPSDPSAHGIFSWMKSNFAKLPGFVGGAVDFGALSSAMENQNS